MAEEFINQGGVCSGSWWNRSRSALFAGGLSPCSAAAGDLASVRWPVESIFGGITSSAGSGWTETLLLGGGASNGIIRTSDQSDITFNSDDIVHEIGLSKSSQIHSDWKPVKDHEDSSTMSAFKDQIDFPAQISETYASHDISSSRRCPSTRKTFLLDQSPPLPGDWSDLPAEDCSSQRCFDDLSSATFGKLSSLLILSNSSLPDPPRPGDRHFSNDTPHRNASVSSLDDIRARLLASSQTIPAGSSLDEKLNWFDLIGKASSQYSQVSGNLEPALKRPRIETPSPLPTFKVRKEKLGDRITALQQLVSPFGKTDTASVLHEAIEYIKFLHDQVSALSAHYVKSNETLFQRQQVCTDRALKDTEKPSLDLRSRGLCLVPISSTFPFTCQTPTDFWTPTFRGILPVNLT